MRRDERVTAQTLNSVIESNQVNSWLAAMTGLSISFLV